MLVLLTGVLGGVTDGPDVEDVSPYFCYYLRVEYRSVGLVLCGSFDVGCPRYRCSSVKQLVPPNSALVVEQWVELTGVGCQLLVNGVLLVDGVESLP